MIHKNVIPFLDPAWHLITGGSYANNILEAYNRKTGQQCHWENLPYDMDAHVGTVFEGVPIICGNYSYGQGDTQCHSLNTKNMAWEKVRSIIISIFKLLENPDILFLISRLTFQQAVRCKCHHLFDH
jgi:hypothetical protein